MRHLDCAHSGVVALVAGFQARAVDGLFERVASENAERHRDAGVELRDLNSASGFRANIVVVRSFAAQDAADADDRIDAAGGCEFFCRKRDFERARDAHDFDLFFVGACLFERFKRAGEQAVGDEIIELADDNTDAQSGCAQLAASHLWFRHRLTRCASSFLRSSAIGQRP